MNVGEKVRFPFAKKEMQGTVEKIFQKTIYILTLTVYSQKSNNFNYL